MFDLNIYPFPPNNSSNAGVPGLLILPPDRKAARGRENDLLVIYFTLEGQSAITEAGLSAWLEKKAEVYHRIPGTVTAGLRAIVEEINSDLFERNSRHAQEGGQVTGHLQMAVVKRDMVYLVSLGASKTLFSIQRQTGTLTDFENNGRGLGLTQAVSPHFVQMQLADSDVIIFSFNSPESWNGEMIDGASTVSMEVLFRRLYAQPAKSARGIFMRVKTGTGKANLLTIQTAKPAAPAQTAVEPASAPTDIQQAPSLQASQPAPVQSAAQKETIAPAHPEPPEATSTAGQPIVTRITDPISRHRHTNPVQTPVEPVAEPAAMPEEHADDRPSAEDGSEEEVFDAVPSSANFKKAVGSTLRKGAEVKNKMDGLVKDTVQKVLPGEADQPVHISRSLRILIAVLVPVIVVTIAVLLINRNGRPSYFNAYLQQAEQLSVRADGQSGDSAARLQSLQESLYWLDKADEYGTSDEAKALRTKIQTGMDDLQGIIRIDMVSVLPQALAASSNITQIVATNTDFYALDASTGQVLRYFISGSGYAQDTAFKCGPSAKPVVKDIGPVVDMVAISSDNQYGATLLAVDAKGNLDYCVPGGAGYIMSLQAPDMGWGSIKSISLDQDTLYVLDITGNAVYRFEGNGLEFTDKPTLFFDENIPSLTQAIDIDVHLDELYILRSNGEMVKCTYSALKAMKSTECIDPAPYTDTRSGKVNQVNTFPEANFVLMRMTAAPDSSIYLLDAKGNTVFHFSYARSLQRILHPRVTDGMEVGNTPPTAFTISPSRIVYMAYKNELFYGQMP